MPYLAVHEAKKQEEGLLCILEQRDRGVELKWNGFPTTEVTI